jgi:threonine/homoserine/homoserine lactone efflux protein
MQDLPAFLAVVAVVLAVPGPDTLVVLRTALTDGARSGIWAGAGSASGFMLWGLASVAGVSAVLATSATAFTLLKLAGAAYLAYLGIQALRAAHRGETFVGDEAAPEAAGLSAARAFRRGIASDLINVKVGLFWTALVPQFLTGAGSALVPLAMVVSVGVLVFVWLAAYAALAARLRVALSRTRPARALNAAMGATFVALAAKLARAEA